MRPGECQALQALLAVGPDPLDRGVDDRAESVLGLTYNASMALVLCHLMQQHQQEQRQLEWYQLLEVMARIVRWRRPTEVHYLLHHHRSALPRAPPPIV